MDRKSTGFPSSGLEQTGEDERGMEAITLIAAV